MTIPISVQLEAALTDRQKTRANKPKRTGGRGAKLGYACVSHTGAIDVDSIRKKKSDVYPDTFNGEKVKRVEVRVIS